MATRAKEVYALSRPRLLDEGVMLTVVMSKVVLRECEARKKSPDDSRIN